MHRADIRKSPSVQRNRYWKFSIKLFTFATIACLTAWFLVSCSRENKKSEIITSTRTHLEHEESKPRMSFFCFYPLPGGEENIYDVELEKDIDIENDIVVIPIDGKEDQEELFSLVKEIKKFPSEDSLELADTGFVSVGGDFYSFYMSINHLDGANGQFSCIFVDYSDGVDRYFTPDYYWKGRLYALIQKNSENAIVLSEPEADGGVSLIKEIEKLLEIRY